MTSRLDMQNGLLLGLPKTQLRKLQIAQNNAARLLSRTPRRDHITPVLERLHWLPVHVRVEYKIMCILHHYWHSPEAPDYLKDLCDPAQPLRALRSGDDEYKLDVKRVQNSYGNRAVFHYGAKIWNQLPYDLRKPQTPSIFKKNLKTFMFRKTF